jgi:hypothetical protein
MSKFYTGVGSRKTPKNILRIMVKLAERLSTEHWILRSGGAKGADSAFEAGSAFSEIYYANNATQAAMEIARKFHPAWNKCSDYAKRLHGRNAFQVLGKNLNRPSDMLICWTPDGAYRHSMRSIRTGGTGTAISIADSYSVNIFNLANSDHLLRIKNYLNS